MAKAPWIAGLAAAGLLVVGMTIPASAQTGDKFSPTYKSRPEDVDAVLKYRPRQEGVDYSRPSAEEQKACTMKLILGERPNSTGWLLLDPQGRPLRRFFDSNGDQKVDQWSYFKDGVEVFREVDSNFNEKADQYRWLNSGGTKWGVDANEDGKIDSWRMISAEEAAQEAFLAMISKDANRLKMVMISDAEITALKLPDAQAARIRDNQAKLQARMADVLAKAPSLTLQAQFKSVEPTVPQCVPAHAATGPAQDLIVYGNRPVLYETADKKHEWLHMGEMILVGQAWRLTDVPSTTDPTGGAGGASNVAGSQRDKKVQDVLDQLAALDKQIPPSPGAPGKHQAVVDYNVKRVALLEQIFAQATDVQEKENWMRQILDNLCTGHQANGGDNTLLVRLAQYKDQLAKAAPGSPLAGYAHYREMWARFAADLAAPKDAVKTQKDWQEELVKFVQAYPKAEDAADAFWQLAMGCEYGSKEKQDEAKKYYGLIVANFPDHPLAPKSKGAVARLELNGKELALAGPTVQGGQFDMGKAKGKVVLVYYWASNVKVCTGDFAQLKQMQTLYGAKGFEIVTVNLDEQLSVAQQYLASVTVPATHLHQANEQAKGLESPLALQYGIVGLPTMILVGRDGRVIDRSIQINELEEAIKKAL